MSGYSMSRRDFLRTGSAAALTAGAGGLLTACGNSAAQSSAFWDNHANPAVSATLPNGAIVNGYCAPAFRPVFDTFVENFSQRKEIGASVALTLKGLPVLEAWGGFTDSGAVTPSRAWQRNTVSLVFSCTKGATALCAHLLAARGLLDLNAPVAKYWPEFAANGKQAVTVRMLLDHSAGLPVLRTLIPAKGWADWGYMTAQLAAQAPFWTPGSAHGYHALTFGWLVGEVVRRVSGMSLGAFFAREVAAPLGLDFWIGLPAEVEARVSPLLQATEVLATDPFTIAALSNPTSLQAFIFNVGDWLTPQIFNTADGHRAEIPAANGISNAQGLAAMYAVLANGGVGQSTRLLPADYTALVGNIQSASHVDRVLLAGTRIGLGYMGSLDNRQVGPDLSCLMGVRAFGHPGFGGSLGFADPQSDLSFGYTMNRMGAGVGLNERGQKLVDSTYQVLGYGSNKYGFWI